MNKRDYKVDAPVNTRNIYMLIKAQRAAHRAFQINQYIMFVNGNSQTIENFILTQMLN